MATTRDVESRIRLQVEMDETIPHDFIGLLQVRRLHKFGVTRGELARYLNALLKDSEHLAAMIDNVPSLDNLDFIMESDTLGHTVMDQQQGHESLLAVAETVTLEDVMGFFTTAPVSAVYYYCLTMDILVTYQPSLLESSQSSGLMLGFGFNLFLSQEHWVVFFYIPKLPNTPLRFSLVVHGIYWTLARSIRQVHQCWSTLLLTEIQQLQYLQPLSLVYLKPYMLRKV